MRKAQNIQPIQSILSTPPNSSTWMCVYIYIYIYIYNSIFLYISQNTSLSQQFIPAPLTSLFLSHPYLITFIVTLLDAMNFLHPVSSWKGRRDGTSIIWSRLTPLPFLNSILVYQNWWNQENTWALTFPT